MDGRATITLIAVGYINFGRLALFFEVDSPAFPARLRRRHRSLQVSEEPERVVAVADQHALGLTVVVEHR